MTENEHILARLKTLEELVLPVIKNDRIQPTHNLVFQRDKKIVGFIYGGYVDSGALSPRLPLGWSAVLTSTGLYTVTHNLNTTNYIAVATGFYNLEGVGFRTAQIYTQSANSFVVNIAVTQTDTSLPFFFIVMLV